MQGMERDHSGLDHTDWRKYDNLSGRWTTLDPLGDGEIFISDPPASPRKHFHTKEELDTHTAYLKSFRREARWAE
jgi:uncharacterized protein RhaS with RHS repeats